MKIFKMIRSEKICKGITESGQTGKKSKEMRRLNGGLAELTLFSIPLAFVRYLQQLFNSADAVAGRFCWGPGAAAVGAGVALRYP